MVPALSRFWSTRSTNRTGWLGVDIGSAAVKLAQVQRRGSYFELLQSRVVPVVDGLDPLFVASEAVESLLGDRRRWLGQPTACVATSQLELRSFNVPASSESNPFDYVADQLGAGSDQVAFAAWPSSWVHENSTGDRPYHAVSIEENRAEAMAIRLRNSHAECNVLDCLPHCLARLVTLTEADHSETVAVLDWAAESPLFVVVRNGQPFFSRLLRHCGFRELVGSIGESLSIEKEDVWNLLHLVGTHAKSQDTSDELVKTITQLSHGACRQFLEELNRTMTFLQSDNVKLVPNRLWLVGAGATLPGIAEEVTQVIQKPTVVWTLARENRLAPHDQTGARDHVLASAISLSAIPIL